MYEVVGEWADEESQSRKYEEKRIKDNEMSIDLALILNESPLDLDSIHTQRPSRFRLDDILSPESC